MKKSKAVPATLIATIAAITLNGCSRSAEIGRCVDASGKLLPDSACQSMGGYGSGSYSSGYHGYMYPHWVYGGHVSGGSVSGYHSSPTSGNATTASGHSISRGGFGGGHGGEAGS